MNHARQNLSVVVDVIEDENHSQRIDNYLISRLKGVPKSRIYRILRKGEVRVNKKRIKPDYKLQKGDQVRIPPIRVSEQKELPNRSLSNIQKLESCILFEDKDLIVIDKPSGMAVHGGSGQSFGVIEAMRSLRPQAKFLELVHRLDRDTSGCLLIAKKRSALKGLHEQLVKKSVNKCYLAIVINQWPKRIKQVDVPLAKNQLKSGERVVRVDNDGKASKTRFQIVSSNTHYSLIRAFPITGRTHQIRVHCQFAECPIVGDEKYCSTVEMQKSKEIGADRLCLHAESIEFVHPNTQERMRFSAEIGDNLKRIISSADLCYEVSS